MERISSRKNAYITHLRTLAADGEYRRSKGEFVCEGAKLLEEAISSGAEIGSVLWREGGEIRQLDCEKQYLAPPSLFDHASTMKNSPGPIFTVRMARERGERAKNAIVLESVQDPGNVGTVLRTANAFGVDAVVLTGECADIFAPKTVRATMGAVFRQRVCRLELSELPEWLEKNGLELCGAALSAKAADIRAADLGGCAVAVGSEGRGLSRELLEMCAGQIVIPMESGSESLNAAVAASIIMWEMYRR